MYHSFLDFKVTRHTETIEQNIHLAFFLFHVNERFSENIFQIALKKLMITVRGKISEKFGYFW